MLSLAGSLALDVLPLLLSQMLGLPYTLVYSHPPVTTTKEVIFTIEQRMLEYIF